MSRHHHEWDWLQTMFLALCLGELIFFLYYLFAFEINSQSTISDTIFSTPEYAVSLTVTLSLRLLGVVMFLCQYNNAFPNWEHAGFFGVFVAFFGWGWLVWHQDNLNHFTGVALFCLGSLTYSIALLKLVGRTHEHLRALHQAMRWFLLITTLILVTVFVILWAIEDANGFHSSAGGNRNAYIVEHVAYVTHILFFATFVLYHSPNPEKHAHLSHVHEKEQLMHPPQDGTAVPMVQIVHIQREI